MSFSFDQMFLQKITDPTWATDDDDVCLKAGKNRCI